MTTGLLAMMAAPIAQGRTFLESEGQPGQFVAVISDRYWRDTLGGGSVLGSALVIDGQPHTIIGILAPTFAVPFMDAQILTPLYANPEPQPRAPPLSVQAVAELAPGATVAQVREELAAINRQLAQEYPRTHTGWLLGVESGPRVAIRIDARAVADAVGGGRVRALDRVREHRQSDLRAGDCALRRARASPGSRRHERRRAAHAPG